MRSLLFLLLGCPSWFGLEELDSLPPEFPLEIQGELGKITRTTAAGSIAVDVAFDAEEDAREHWAALEQQAASRGFRRDGERSEKNRETHVYVGPGTLELGCCPRRVDRRFLVFVEWTPQAGTGP